MNKSDLPILAIDQSYTATGLAMLADGNILSWEVIKPASKLCRAAKRSAIVARLAGLPFVPGLLVIEEQWEKPGISLSTAIIDYAYGSGIEIKALNVHSWKKAVLGNGNGSKQDAMEKASQIIGVTITDDNAADAICIALCAHQCPELLKKPE